MHEIKRLRHNIERREILPSLEKQWIETQWLQEKRRQQSGTPKCQGSAPFEPHKPQKHQRIRTARYRASWKTVLMGKSLLKCVSESHVPQTPSAYKEGNWEWGHRDLSRARRLNGTGETQDWKEILGSRNYFLLLHPKAGNTVSHPHISGRNSNGLFSVETCKPYRERKPRMCDRWGSNSVILALGRQVLH